MSQLLYAGIGYLMSQLSYLPSILLLGLLPFGIKHYSITGDRDINRSVLQKLRRDGHSMSRRVYATTEYPSKLCIGSKFLAWINTDPGYVDCWDISILCSQSYYESLIHVPDVAVPEIQPSVKQTLVMLARRGGMDDFRYREIRVDPFDLTPKGDQRAVLDAIVSVFRETRVARIFLSGPPGTGKSAVGLLLAKELDGTYCHTFDPLTPGDELLTVYGTHRECGAPGPLVLVLEEANGMIRSIHRGVQPHHKKAIAAIKDKSSWCNFLDDLVFLKNIVLIFTSNQPPEEMDTLDPAYLRANRIDARLSMETTLHSSP